MELENLTEIKLTMELRRFYSTKRTVLVSFIEK